MGATRVADVAKRVKLEKTGVVLLYRLVASHIKWIKAPLVFLVGRGRPKCDGRVDSVIHNHILHRVFLNLDGRGKVLITLIAKVRLEADGEIVGIRIFFAVQLQLRSSEKHVIND